MKLARNILISFIIFSLIILVTYQPGLAGVLPLQRLAEVETLLYGESQQDAIIKRVGRLEKTLYNQRHKGTLINRTNNIVNYVLTSIGKPSLVFLINTIEWSLTGNISRGTILARLDQLEQIVYGQSKTGSLVERVSKLAELSLPGGKVPSARITVPANTLVRIKILSKISSDVSQIGQIIDYEVVNDVKIDGKLVIPAGTRGNMRVKDIDEAGKMGKDADVQLDFSKLMTIDGTKISLKLDKEAQEENRSRKLAVGASLLGTVILGPVGLIAGYFVEGREKDIPAGTEIYVQTVRHKDVYGLELY